MMDNEKIIYKKEKVLFFLVLRLNANFQKEIILQFRGTNIKETERIIQFLAMVNT